MKKNCRGEIVIHENTRFKVVADTTSSEAVQTVFFIKKNDSVGIIATWGERIALVRVMRQLLKEELWELPGGRIEDNEEPLNAAVRELAEETGIEGKDWQRIGIFYPMPGLVNERMHLFECKAIGSLGDVTLNNDETLEIRFLDRTQVIGMIKNRVIKSTRDGFAILYWYLINDML